jgi:hypothetical protein
MKRSARGAFILGGILVGLAAAPAPAGAQQTLNLNLGYFALRGEDSRIDDDVLVENLDLFAFEIGDFNFATIGGEYLVGLGEHFEAGVGVGFYQRTVPTVYRDFVRPDGSEIEQELKLRMIPVAATLRLLPLGSSSGFQPYVGGGIAMVSWRYTETGEFLDEFDVIFRDSYEAEDSAFGPVILGGLRGGSGPVVIGGEVRYQKVKGRVGREKGFFAEDIDLGGITLQATIGVRF